MNKIAILKKALRNLSDPSKFDGTNPFTHYPHCVIGEIDHLAGKNVFDDEFSGVFHQREMDTIGGHLRQRTALKILRNAIKRLERKENQ